MSETYKLAPVNEVSSLKEAISGAKVTVKKEASLPFIIWLVVIATGAAFFGGEGILGYRMSGLAWLVPLLFSILTIVINSKRITFPYGIWLPWILLLVIYLFYVEFRPLQRTIQLICPIIVGTAVSTCKVNLSQLKSFIRLCKRFSIAIFLIALLNTGVFLTGRVPIVTGLAAQAMTAVLLCSLFAARYAIGRKKDLFWWAFMAALPVFGVTRTATLAAGITLPLTLGPMGLRKRVLILLVVLFGAFGVFHTERMQLKMFRSGRGEISDIQSDEFRDNARFFMWDKIKSRIKRKPWFGYGTGSGEAFTRVITAGVSGYPHNDWLLTMHDQGILGTTVFSLCMIWATFHAWRRAQSENAEIRVLFLAGASAFVPFAVIMYADNIMVYVSYFGNLHFTFIGLAYAASRGKGADHSKVY